LKLTDTERIERNMVKAVRSQIRLKHSIKADNELFRLLPDLKKDFDAAAKNGKAKEFALAKITEVTDAL
jgi:hypothetical protein